MKTLFVALLVMLACLAGAQSNQPITLNLSSPLDYQVFQRDTKSAGKIVIEATLETNARGALTNLEKLEARLIGKTAVGELPGEWQPLPFDNRVRRFRAELTATAGGWYRLEARLIGGGTNISEATIEHVGIGEVFLVAGQSNSANHGEGLQQPKSGLVVAYGDGRWQIANDPQPVATGKGGSFLPAFGDAMATRFKVPIGLVPLGVGATSVREWLPRGERMAAPPDMGRNTICAASNVWLSAGELFERITSAEQMLGTNGFRAVLWHQGESDCFEPPDRQISPAQYRDYLQHVIEASRVAAGWRVPWFVAQVSYHPVNQVSSELRAAQKSLVTDGIVFAGPNTDELGPELRQNNGKGIHMNPKGLQKHGELWAECIGPWLETQMDHSSRDGAISGP